MRVNAQCAKGESIRGWVLLLSLVGLLLTGLPVRSQAQGPDDPLYVRQWALRRIGAPCAWQYTHGSASVVVAVLDTGVDLEHPDLSDRLVPGYDFVDGDTVPRDEYGHGTHVAGIIAAVSNNGIGVAGVADGVHIMPIRVLDSEGFGYDADIADGIRYAADHGARVINMSLGSVIPSGDTIDHAIDYAIDQGVVVVIAAGNDFLPLPNWAGGLHPDTIVVAATDENDVKAPFSNTGPWVDISAPGVDIYSTVPTYPVFLTTERGVSQDYDALDGTSMATPFVSAVAALVFSAHPSWSASQVRQHILNTAADISEENPEWQNEFQPMLGSGRVDACAALTGASVATPTPSPLPATMPTKGPTVLLPPETIPVPVSSPLPPETTITEGDTPPPITETPTGIPATPTMRVARTPTRETDRENSPGGTASTGSVLFVTILVGGLLIFFYWNNSRPVPQAIPPAPQLGGSGMVTSPQPQGPVWGWLLVRSGPHTGQRFPLQGDHIDIGRSRDLLVQLFNDHYVSRHHARVLRQGQQIAIRDLGSTHGTRVNGQLLTQTQALRDGLRIQVGQSELLIHLRGDWR